MAQPDHEPRAVCFIMMKGGFGKSIFVNSIAGVLGDFRDHRVLVADLDLEGHLSTGLGYYTRKKDSAPDLGDVLLRGTDPQDIIKHPGYGFDFIPSLNLKSIAEDLSRDSVFASDSKLKQELVDPLLGEEYDYILFDLPGTQNKLVNNAVIAAPNAIIPLKPVPEAKNGLRGTAALIGEVRKHIDFNILAVVPNDLSRRIDQRTQDRRLLEDMNTDQHFAAYLMAGRGANPDAGKLPKGMTVEEILDSHVPPFARVREDVWAAIDSGELNPVPKIPIRHAGELGDAYDNRMPITAYDPECDQIEHFEILANIIEQGGIDA